jgi:Fructose-2,6-bisphosphatase
MRVSYLCSAICIGFLILPCSAFLPNVFQGQVLRHSKYDDFRITKRYAEKNSKTNRRDKPHHSAESSVPRREFFQRSGAATAASLSFFSSAKSEARGLVKFPCNDYEFQNTYHFFRAGESLLEEEGIWSTNPLFLTNRESALSPKGIEQVEEMCKKLRSDGVAPTIVRYSLAASAIDSSNIIGRELKIGRDRLVPEFNFMDPRAIGSWDMSRLNVTLDAVWAMDVDEAGKDGKGGRPPSNDDGTPHETLSDQVVRLQNLISVLETQYSGDTVLLVFPDGTGPALLTCLIGGIPLNRVHEFEYQNGEVRLNITYESAHSLLASEPSTEYLDAISRGRNKLQSLLEHPDEVLNVREQQYEEELRKEAEMKAAQAADQENARKQAEKLEMTKDRTSQADMVQRLSFDGNITLVAGLAAAGVVGSVSLFKGDDNQDSNLTEKGENILQSSEQGVGGELIEAESRNGDGQIGSPDIFPETALSSSDTSKNNSKTVSIEMRPTSNTLQENTWNLDVDDGGEAWLGTLNDIIKEEDDQGSYQETQKQPRDSNGQINGGSSVFE